MISPAADSRTVPDTETWARPRGGVALILLVLNLFLVPVPPRSAPEPPLAAADLRLRINPNTATAAELHLLPRVGARLAETVVAYRGTASRQPPFQSADDLERVPRIGRATVELLQPYLALPEAPTEPE